VEARAATAPRLRPRPAIKWSPGPVDDADEGPQSITEAP
jgi:hypothetical protein